MTERSDPKLSQNDAITLFKTVSPYMRIAHVLRAQQRYVLAPRIIFDHLLLYTKQGGGWIGIGGRRYRQEPETLFLIRPYVQHWQEGDEDSRFVMLNIHFDFVQRQDSATTPFCLNTPAQTLAATSKFRPDPTLTPPFYLPEKIAHFIPTVYEKLFAEVAKWASLKGPSAELHAKAAMLELLAHLYHFQKSGSTSSEAAQDLKRFDGVLKYIMEHLSRQIELDDLAARCRMSRSHFSRRFKECFDVAPMKYISRLRITQAKHHLIEGRPIKQIADELGYATVHHFTRLFKQFTGCPPAQFRATQQKAQ